MITASACVDDVKVCCTVESSLLPVEGGGGKRPVLDKFLTKKMIRKIF